MHIALGVPKNENDEKSLAEWQHRAMAPGAIKEGRAALVIAAGKKDEIFPAEGTEKTFELIKSLYKYAGALDSCALVWGEGGHYNYADLLWEKIHEMGF